MFRKLLKLLFAKNTNVPCKPVTEKIKPIPGTPFLTKENSCFVWTFKRPKRKVNKVFIHCSASGHKHHDCISVIRKWHKKRGFKKVGYHYFIRSNGVIQKGRSLELIPASQKGHNRESISICISGLRFFSSKALESLVNLCSEINLAYNDIKFFGHCEVNPEKTCPNFNYKEVLNLKEDGTMMIT